MSRITKYVLTATLVMIAALMGISVATADQEADISNQDAIPSAFDVVEDHTRFVFHSEHTYEDGMPAYGSAFVTAGYIYPAGTLTDSNGILEDGSPEFPDLVIGEWNCRGFFVGEGMYTEAGAVVITTQTYNFGDDFGEDMLISDGYELADPNVPFSRAISGGTGTFAIARGELEQTLMGFSDYMGVKLTFEANIQ